MSTQKRGQVSARPQRSSASSSHQGKDHDKSPRGLSTLGQAALGYASKGFGVIPCRPRGKGPLIPEEEGGHGVHDATTDEQQIIDWWRSCPNANIGLALPKGMAALDVDPRNHGTNEGLPPTLVQKSGGGGEHWLYSDVPKRLPGKIREGLDVKANGGGYILAEPSVHPSGEAYHWVQGFDPKRITRFPSEFEPMFDTRGKAKGNGEDHDLWDDYQLNWALERIESENYWDWIGIGMILQTEYGDVEFDRWVKWSERSDKFPGEEGCKRKWDSFRRDNGGERKGLGTLSFMLEERGFQKIPPTDPRKAFPVYVPEKTDSKITFVTANQVQVRKKTWVWTHRIADRSVSLLAGEGGVGKGHITVEIVATVTQGKAWVDDPFEHPVLMGHVLWFCAEDDPETELKPRLIAGGVNMERVHLFQRVRKEKNAVFSIQEDMALLDTYIRTEVARGVPIRLVIFDPVTSYLHGRNSRAIDTHNATQLRMVLQPLSELSHKHNIAILGITHFAKDSARRMIHRVVGSQVWTAVARSVLFAAKLDPEMRSEEAQNAEKVEYVLMSGKGNNAPGDLPALRYQLEGANFMSNGELIETSKLSWTKVDHHLSEEDLASKSQFGPPAMKARNMEKSVRRMFDEVSGKELPATQVIQRLVDEKFGTEKRVSKDLAGVEYLVKKRLATGWSWAIVEEKE